MLTGELDKQMFIFSNFLVYLNIFYSKYDFKTKERMERLSKNQPKSLLIGKSWVLFSTCEFMIFFVLLNFLQTKSSCHNWTASTEWLGWEPVKNELGKGGLCSIFPMGYIFSLMETNKEKDDSESDK